MGYAAGALIAGAAADALGYGGAIALVAALTAGSGLWVLIDMPAGRASPGVRDSTRSKGGVPPMPPPANSGAMRR